MANASATYFFRLSIISGPREKNSMILSTGKKVFVAFETPHTICRGDLSNSVDHNLEISRWRWWTLYQRNDKNTPQPNLLEIYVDLLAQIDRIQGNFFMSNQSKNLKSFLVKNIKQFKIEARKKTKRSRSFLCLHNFHLKTKKRKIRGKYLK